jgi:beta-carotene/zeaxanthin 4-ketolase
MQTVLSTKRLNPKLAIYNSGILIAIIVISLWLSSLIILLSIDIEQLPWFLLIIAVLLRSFLHTGLFITAHDAMHGTVFPQHRQLNDFIGSLAARMYVFLPYKLLLEKHRLHHQYPASTKDPDFCEDGNNNPILWYVSFMKGYLEGKQSWVVFIGMSLIFYPLWLGLNIGIYNLVLFWLLPIFISSIQLFSFGIFLPHHQPQDGYTNCHRAKSSNFSVFWSFLTCYHFGYHWEHHEYPHLPWYKLPSVVKG